MLGEFFSIFLTFFLVMNVFGMIPTYLTLIEHFEKKRRFSIALREFCFAFLMMLFFYYVGPILLKLLDIKPTTTEITGGIVLFLISLRLIFGSEDVKEKWEKGNHLFVPIATPVIAGPSLFATIMIYEELGVAHKTILLALLANWLLASFLYLGAKNIYNTLKSKGLDACQRLMGLLLGLIAVEKVLHGIHLYFNK